MLLRVFDSWDYFSLLVRMRFADTNSERGIGAIENQGDSKLSRVTNKILYIVFATLK
jgi:hypothetical protein